MPKRQPALPAIWLVSDRRNDARLATVLARLPRGSGLVYRHYHLAPSQRRARYAALAALARARGHQVVLSGTAREARTWGADGVYGPPARLAHGPGMPRFITAHTLAEIGAARRARADAIVLSPVFATRSHPGARMLGAVRFRLLAARAGVPVIALGGMSAVRARRLGCRGWAAIDGPFPEDS